MRHRSRGLSGSIRTIVPLIALVLLLVPRCSSGGDDASDEILDPDGSGTLELHYDAENLTAPQLAAASSEAAARFPTTQTATIGAGRLVGVRFYVTNIPASCMVKIYGAGTASSPGGLLYSADVTGSLAANGWNTHTLSSPVPIPNGDLWISVAFTNAGPQSTIGCDPGPAVPDGDWLYASTDGSWIPLSGRTAIDINWNVRGIVELPE
jgi:hypothetical protein